MNRRSFTKLSMAGLSTVAGHWGKPLSVLGGGMDHPSKQMVRGVNLGGWLVLEKWITPSVFADLKAKDEAQLGEELGARAAASRLSAHREKFITGDDFKWIAERGLNAVRIPVGYWVLEAAAPFVSAPDELDWAFAEARKNGLGVLLDLHGAPGSQNGWDHSGRVGTIAWHTSKENIERTLRALENLAERYKRFDNLLGIELLNEPHWTVPLDILADFYQEAYRRLRRRIGDRVAIVIHDGFRALAWSKIMQGPAFPGVILDTHLYQVFTPEDQQRDTSEHLQIAAIERKKQIDEMQRHHPVYIGEWSLALPKKSFEGRSAYEVNITKRAFADVQLVSYENAVGWFFWTYRTEKSPEWSLSESVKRGWLPDQFGEPGPATRISSPKVL
jgi:glucan 1,3-beta-glucosidase